MKRIFAIIALFSLMFAARAVLAGDADLAYTKAKSCYGELKVAPKKAANHGAWERCIGLFEGVHRRYQDTERGAQALYNVGKLRTEAYAKLRRLDDAEAAIKAFNQFIKEYPKNSLADDSLYQIGKLRHDPFKEDERARKAFSYLIDTYPNGDMAPKAKQELKALGESKSEEKVAAGDETESSDVEAAPATAATAEAGKKVPAKSDAAAAESGSKKKGSENAFTGEVAGPKAGAIMTSLDVDKKESETVISLTLTRRAAYSLDFTEEGKHTKSPPRLEMLIPYTKADQSIAKDQNVDSPFLTSIRMKRDLLGGGTKLIFEMTPQATYEIVAKGGSIVVRFKKSGGGLQGRVPGGQRAEAEHKKTVASAKLQGKGPVIVIDPGHGGADTGAVGPGGLEEKNVTLSISKLIKAKLKEELGAIVYLTRTDDKTISLEDRDAFAVAKKAALFISVHANASTDRKTTGIETYFLNNATDAAAAKLAKRENKAAKKNLSNVEHILSTMLMNYDAAESELLASDVQSSLMNGVGKKYKGVRNRRVRSALFYVLVGAKCPSILVETSFISNPQEAKRLSDGKYQRDVAQGISDGIRKYIKSSDQRMVKL